jgi:hypothetical protein
MNTVVSVLTAWIGTSILIGASEAQQPKSSSAPAPARVAAAARPQIQANLAQLMRGTLCPASNVIFAAQDQNPNDVPLASDPSVAINPLASSYGKWQAVENSSLVIFEVASLLSLPGHKCLNGLDAPQIGQNSSKD